MAQPTITGVRILGLHGQQSISIDLTPGLNIVHAKNGMGKTTLLHVLANLAERDLTQFLKLRFDRISVETSAGTHIDIRQVPGERPTPLRVQLSIDGTMYGEIGGDGESPVAFRKLLGDALGKRPVYLPAFRSILEAVSQRRVFTPREPQVEAYQRLVMQEIGDVGQRRHDPTYYRARETAELTAAKTLQCREWFGRFVPVIRCPSIAEVSEELVRELSDARFKVVNTDIEVSGDVFVEVLRAALRRSTEQAPDRESVGALFGRIREYLSSLPEPYRVLLSALNEIPDPASLKDRETIPRILSVYEQALKRRIHEGREAYKRIETFLGSVNQFLEQPKQLVIAELSNAERELIRERIVVDSQSKQMGLQVLSSGERQVLLLLFSATHMSSGDGMLLIDEPELSLHLGWQRFLLRELMAQAGERQVVVCTHAPELAADHPESERNLQLVPWVPEQTELELPEEKEPGP